MTKPLLGSEISEEIRGQLQDVIIGFYDDTVIVKNESVLEVCRYLNQTPTLDFDFLVGLTAVDYLDYFELVYHLLSLKHNHSLVLKARCHDREHPTAPSVTSIWKGADLQEREIYDLFGIHFNGHPNMKRLFLWDGFQGHPLRKDFL